MRQILFILLWIAVGCKTWATPMPQSTAAHFCQLLVQDADGKLKSLNAFANGDAPLFAEYVFQHDGWRDLRIFPMKISKYCMGVTMTIPTIKHNRFKEKLIISKRSSHV